MKAFDKFPIDIRIKYYRILLSTDENEIAKSVDFSFEKLCFDVKKTDFNFFKNDPNKTEYENSISQMEAENWQLHINSMVTFIKMRKFAKTQLRKYKLEEIENR